MLMVGGICGCGQQRLSFGRTSTNTSSHDFYSYGCGYGYGYSNSIVCQRHHTGATIAITTPKIRRRKYVPFSFHPMQMTTELAVSAVSVAVIFLLTTVAAAADADVLQSEDSGTLSNVPQMLSGDCITDDCKKPRIQRPKSRKAETCTVKCLTTCIRGGLGSPGEGPLNLRRPLVVFKQGFRSRQYCLTECSDICNLIGDGDDGP